MILQETIDKQIGKKYGRFLVLEFSHKKGTTQYFYKCRCDCGIEKNVRINYLKEQGKKQVVSCGCYILEKKTLRAGQAAFNNLYSKYRLNAKYRNLSFTLTSEQLRHLTSSDCYYCGKKPERVNHPKTYYGGYIYNGIDRIDNSMGYDPDNCAAACSQCNSIKNAISKDMIFKLYHLMFGEYKDHIHINGQSVVSNGLLNRRREERDLFLS